MSKIEHQGAEFVRQVFGPGTETPVFLSSFSNADAKDREPGEKYLLTRDLAAVASFAAKWDRPDRGLYFCVSTLTADARPERPGGSPRNKANVAEIALLHADVDLKSVEVGIDEIVARVDALPCPPSVAVASGNGLHLYWLLNEGLLATAEEVERVEAALRQLADLVGGDLAVAEVSRLMRLPGSHNTKDGAWKPVEVLQVAWERRYELGDLEDMLAYVSPVVRRRAPASKTQIEPENPFLAAARRLGFKPPIDVEQRLDAMAYQGPGDASIHQTQLSVTASLLSRGSDLEDVVETVLAATRAAAGEFGSRWNWGREERAVRRMCEDWVRKNPVQASRPSSQAGRDEQSQEATAHEVRATGTGTVVLHLERERERRKPKEKVAGKKETPNHLIIAAAMIEAAETEGRPYMAVSEENGERQLWRYENGLWRTIASIDVDVETAARAIGIPTTMKLRSEIMAAIRSDPAVVRAKAEVSWDGHGLVPAANGLVNVETLSIEPYRPGHFATWRLPHVFDASSRCPLWERSLAAFFRDKGEADRATYQELIRDVAGAGLMATRPRSLSRALVLFGPQNAGKSQILQVLTGLYGKSPIAQPLSSLDGEHGTVPFFRHAPWVLHEAFTQGKWVFSDKMKSLITSEPVQINFKRGAQIEHVFRAPIFWATNHPPSVRDASRAVSSRMLVVPCNAAFDDRAPAGVAAEAAREGFQSVSEYVLAREGAGVLRWAVEGLRTVLKRGRFEVPDEMVALDQEIYDDANPVAEFVRECCAFDPDRMARITDWMAAYAIWWGEQRGENLNVPSTLTVGRALVSLGDPRIGTDKVAFRTKDDRFYGGLVLNEVGLDYWNAAESGAAARGKAARLSNDKEGVNRPIPPSWEDREPVQRMRKAHRERSRSVGTDSGDSRGDRWVTDAPFDASTVTSGRAEPVF